MRRSTTILGFLVFLFGAFTFGQSKKEMQKAIEQELAQKVLTIRGFYRDEDLRFDAQGSVTKGGTPGYNGSDAGMEIRKVEIKTDALILSGTLPVLFLDPTTGKIRYLHGLVKRRVEIALASPVTQAGAMELLWKVFFRPHEQIGDCPADEATRIQKVLPQAAPEHGGWSGLQVSRRGCDPKPSAVVRVGGPVTPPRAVETPDPAYSDKARADRVSGIVILNVLVTPEGQPQSIIVMRPLGEGLDEEAARSVHAWRFDPAMRDGKPVAVVLSIEVNFHLYR